LALFEREVDVDEDEAEDRGEGEAEEMLVDGSFELESSCLCARAKKLGTRLFMVCLMRPSLCFLFVGVEGRLLS
jgi:hypothetical protein